MPRPRVEGTDLLILAGIGAGLAGVYLLAGLAWLLIALGLLLMVTGVLIERGRRWDSQAR